MTKAGASERALKAAEEVRSLAMDYFGYATMLGLVRHMIASTATGDTNEVYQKFPVTGVAAIIDAEFPAGDRRKGERREGSSSGADKDYCLTDGSYRRKSERRKNTTEQVRKLREALEGIEARQMEDGSPCWCVSPDYRDQYSVILELGEHTWYCQQARTALAGSEVRQLGADDLAFEHANTVIKKYMDDLSPSPCGVEGHRKVDWTDWTERRLRERRVVAHICTPYSGDCVKLHPGRIGKQRVWRSDKLSNSRIHVNRRVTNSGGYCVRCMEIKRAVTDALECRRQDLHCERWKVLPRQFIDKGTAAIRGKEMR